MLCIPPDILNIDDSEIWILKHVIESNPSITILMAFFIPMISDRFFIELSKILYLKFTKNTNLKFLLPPAIGNMMT